MRLTVVIPCYNEAARLRAEPFQAFLDAHPGARLLTVDDGSTDETAAVLATLPGRVVALPENRGKAEAVRAGMLAALQDAPEAIAVWDADLSAPLHELDAMVDRLGARPDLELVMGSRVAMLGYDITRSSLRHYIGRLFSTAASISLGLPVYDTQCGAKLWRVTPRLPGLLAEPFAEPWLYDVELLFRLMAQLPPGTPLPVEELPLRAWHHEPDSKVHPLDLPRSLWALTRIRRRYRA